MDRYTYRDLIRKYAYDVADGHADQDLNPRERRLCRVALNIASNADAANVEYPPTADARDRTVRHLADIVWESRALVEAVSPSAGDAFTVALDRAIEIVRGL